MTQAFETQFTKDQLLKYANPTSEAEAAQFFICIEDNGDRVHAGVVGAIGLGHRVCYRASEFVAA